MRKPASMRGLENLGRVRLSRSFYMRDMLYSEISNVHGVPNIPDRPDVAVARGKQFCETILEPMQNTFGRLAIRSAYRSAAVNAYGNENNLNCARNDNPDEIHIWDYHDDADAVAGASVVVPWFADQYEAGRDWRDLAWWIHDHLPYSNLWFFPKLAAFNIAWRPVPEPKISSYAAPKGSLLKAGSQPDEPIGARKARYADFPPFEGIAYP